MKSHLNTFSRSGPRAALLILGVLLLNACLSAADSPTRILLVTGGHAYETNQFEAMFKSFPGVELKTATHPHAHAWLKADRAREYDVLVLYDMWQEIDDEARADFTARLREGKGLVSLHHSMANYQGWPEFERIIGGKYNLEPRTVDGEPRPGSTFKHDVIMDVRVANNHHPVLRGVDDFEIHDETYGQFDVLPEVQTLLTTSQPTSSPIVAWAKRHERARVVFIQLGHDHFAYENPAYRRLVANAIHWVAGKN